MSRNTFIGDDARLRKDQAAAVRGPIEHTDAARTENDGTGLSPEERRALLRASSVQEILPSVPDIPGYHVCWLSTTNSTDPIYRRMKIGYTPVKAVEIPGFDYYKVSGGEFEGGIACKEMVLFKIKKETYLDLMTIYHHDMPNEEESSIKDKLMGAIGRDSAGRDLAQMEGDGLDELGKNRQPVFSN